ncbi:hypothetical protein [Bombilactobacillus thymidiniphilus]|uniref:Uncharacterized protein n=1 Tax=Bombilactobacillus thymidiniphilus TaxID=2923363 RepID=A0ABY4PBK7_9LACO|nr:hypothetical protein [Bombilactobacillus thymidiniphilus]UQS83048.1 hypothetical protein MOO47_04490 [Bombilactobacillus thymidiniphilus]
MGDKQLLDFWSHKYYLSLFIYAVIFIFLFLYQILAGFPNDGSPFIMFTALLATIISCLYKFSYYMSSIQFDLYHDKDYKNVKPTAFTDLSRNWNLLIGKFSTIFMWISMIIFLAVFHVMLLIWAFWLNWRYTPWLFLYFGGLFFLINSLYGSARACITAYKHK